MPTKPNRAGEQQNYVPAGNGDASGEYGDNSTGSNKHFTAFKKPKKESRIKELDKNKLKQIGKYVDYYQGSKSNQDFIKDFRYYTGSFGNLSNFTDEDLENIIDEFRDLETTKDKIWYQEKGKWKSSYNKGLLDKLGIQSYTLEEREKKEIEDNQKLIANSQTTQDKEIQSIMNENCVVCFGKGYKKEQLNRIVEDTKILVNDWEDLKSYVNAMGDRNNLEKFLNAQRNVKPITEEEIERSISQIKSYNPNLTLDETYLRELAIIKIKSGRGNIKLSKDRNAYAYWSPNIKSMVYQEKMKNLSEEQREYEYNQNFKSSNKINATFYHEMGHAIDSMLKDMQTNIKSTLEKSGNLYTIWETKLKPLNQNRINFENEIDNLYYQNYNKDTNKYNISKYGNTNKAEFVAECFSAYYTGMNNPLANKVVEAFKNYYEKLKEFK